MVNFLCAILYLEMKKRCFSVLLISILLLAAGGTLYAQEERREKYNSLSKRGMKLDQNVPRLLEQAEALMVDDPEGALNKVEEALAMSISQKSVFNRARCYMIIARINENIFEWGLVIDNYSLSRSLLKSAYHTTPEYKQTLKGLGNGYMEVGNYEEARRYFEELSGLKLTAAEQADALLSLAGALEGLGRYEQALGEIDKAEKLIGRTSTGDAYLSGRAQSARARIFARNEQVEEAEDLYVQSQESIDGAAEDPVQSTGPAQQSLKSAREEIISNYRKQNRLDDEIEIRSKAIESNTLKETPEIISEEKQAIGKVLIEQGRTTDAIARLEEAVAISDSIDDAEGRAGSYKALAEAYEKAGNASEALSAYNKYAEAIDDLKASENVAMEKKEGILRKQTEIDALTRDMALDESEYELGLTSARLTDQQLWMQRLIIYGLLFLLLAAAVVVWIVVRNARKTETMGMLLALKSLRGQMNPHFIFNALNSVNQFINSNDERSANKFISEFSRLMRLVLDCSQRDFISLQEEKDIISLYLKLEHYRFRDKFDYTLDIDQAVQDTPEEIVPPMLVQPFIENAIWHGLRYKEEKGILHVSMSRENGSLVVHIKDDGIGRKRSEEMKTRHQKKHNSTGLRNTMERIAILNKVYKRKFEVRVEDVNEDHTGTKVEIILPVH